jgi:hypothetical protein
MADKYMNYMGIRINKVLPPSVKLDLDNIKLLLDKEFEIDIFTKTRKQEYVDARRIFIAIVYSKYDLVTNWGGGVRPGFALKMLTVSILADYMGFHHSTVLHLSKDFNIHMSYSVEFRRIHDRVKSRTCDNIFVTLKGLILEKEQMLANLTSINSEIEILENKKNEIYKNKDREEVIKESYN